MVYTILNKMNKENIIFWEKDKKGITKISNTKFSHFLNKIGIWSCKIDKRWLSIKVENHIVNEIDNTEISKIILNWVKNTDLSDSEKYTLEEVIRGKINFLLGKGQLDLSESFQFDLKRDDKYTSYLYYNNHWLEINKNTVKVNPYSNLDGHIWKNKILSRNFNELQFNLDSLVNECVFAKFIWNISNQKIERFKSICSIIGYLLHEYNNSTLNKAIIFMDEQISDYSEGGTGKGIVMNAIAKLRESLTLDGKNFTFNSRFAFQDVSYSTSILVFDDVKINFNFNKLFSVLTGGMNIEMKGKKRFSISEYDTPKILINTNYVLKGNGNSHVRRKIEFEFSQYYNGKRTPYSEFGHIFFEEWNDEEWNLFDNFMVKCLQLFLDKSIIKTEPINIAIKKAKAETCIEFEEFISEYKTDIKYSRNVLMKKFENEYTDIKSSNWYTNRLFCKWLRGYSDIMGFDYQEKRGSDGDTYFIFQTEKIKVEVKQVNKKDRLRKLFSELENNS